jgi:hypothetical protein
MGTKVSNNASSTLAGAISAAATSVPVASGEGARFPVLAAGDWFPATIVKVVAGVVSQEIVYVTARSGDTFTVTRAQEGTTALSFSGGDKIEVRLTAGTVSLIEGQETLKNKTITGHKETKTAPAIASGVVPIDCSAGNAFAVSMTANITSFDISNVPASGTLYSFILELAATGTARTVTWSFDGVTVKWSGGTAPTLTSTNGKKDAFTFYTYDGGATWIGATIGANF